MTSERVPGPTSGHCLLDDFLAEVGDHLYDELVTVVDLRGLRAEVRAAAAAARDELHGWLCAEGIEAMARPGRRRPRTDATGRARWARHAGGWDWLDAMGRAEQRQVRRHLRPGHPHSPDVTADRVRALTGQYHLSDDEACEWLAEQWLRADALASVAVGRTPSYHGLDDLCLTIEGRRYLVSQLWADDAHARDHVAAVIADETVDQWATRWAELTARPTPPAAHSEAA